MEDSYKKKVLFVGDLRLAYNYGAIATSESLLELFKTVSNVNLRIIDYRSFLGDTPEEGFPQNNKYQTSVSKYIPSNLPARLDFYEEAVEKFKAGTLWPFEKRQIEWADIVIINSEGNLVNGTDEEGYYRARGRYVLFFAYLTKFICNKPCYVINHTVDPKNRDIIKIIQHVYPKLDGVYLREQLSTKLLDSIGVHNYKYVPDALWSHDFSIDPEVRPPQCLSNFDFSQPYICIGDSSGIQNHFSTVKWNIVSTYMKLIKKLKTFCPNIIFVMGLHNNKDIRNLVKLTEIPSVSLNNCNYHELYYVLKNAKLFISGRWHASIIALKGHTPILCWGADSHKTEALYTEINYQHEFFDVNALPLNTDRIAKEAKIIMEEDFKYVWDKVNDLQVAAHDNLDMLRK